MKLTKYEQLVLKPLLNLLLDDGLITKKTLFNKYFHKTTPINISPKAAQFEDIPSDNTILLQQIKEAQITILNCSEPELLELVQKYNNILNSTSRSRHLSHHLKAVIILALVKSGLRVLDKDYQIADSNILLHYNGVSIVDGPSTDIILALA